MGEMGDAQLTGSEAARQLWQAPGRDAEPTAAGHYFSRVGGAYEMQTSFPDGVKMLD